MPSPTPSLTPTQTRPSPPGNGAAKIVTNDVTNVFAAFVTDAVNAAVTFAATWDMRTSTHAVLNAVTDAVSDASFNTPANITASTVSNGVANAFTGDATDSANNAITDAATQDMRPSTYAVPDAVTAAATDLVSYTPPSTPQQLPPTGTTSRRNLLVSAWTISPLRPATVRRHIHNNIFDCIADGCTDTRTYINNNVTHAAEQFVAKLLHSFRCSL